MKAPGLDDRIVAVTAYLTDEAFGYDHWRATQFLVDALAPVADHKRPALLVILASERERDDAAALWAMHASDPIRLAIAKAPGSVEAIAAAAERMQSAAYDLPAGPLRTRLLADSVVVLQELARLATPRDTA